MPENAKCKQALCRLLTWFGQNQQKTKPKSQIKQKKTIKIKTKISKKISNDQTNRNKMRKPHKCIQSNGFATLTSVSTPYRAVEAATTIECCHITDFALLPMFQSTPIILC